LNESRIEEVSDRRTSMTEATGTSQDNAIANIWNMTGACDPTPEQFDALDADTVARENGALRAWLNPVRRWMFDRLDAWEAGDDRTFGGITGTWVGVAGAATMIQATVQGSYYPGYIYRNNTFTFNEGSEVYLLDAPDGEVFVTQSFTRHWDPTPASALAGDAGEQGPRESGTEAPTRARSAPSRRQQRAQRLQIGLLAVDLLLGPTAAGSPTRPS
jgi:hypothetical protein